LVAAKWQLLEGHLHNLIVSVLPVFKALVRPHLEHGVHGLPIWLPCKMKDIEEIEKV